MKRRFYFFSAAYVNLQLHFLFVVHISFPQAFHITFHSQLLFLKLLLLIVKLERSYFSGIV